ncbi:hypothetical protein IRM71_12990 [Erwinia amylovora]|uniref:GlsB/YeaQ/YmgE family stress response membrane protein n=1 Tax=Erwinia amylovora TaxID=552 RepID=UPI001D07B567|nr:hypothetical protein [Erwinia amylovora]UDJ87680.1 hypothetical protein IRM68_04845 [Erwinia amylovora]UDJ99137.1 hypothetical protein IRM69_00835 [Erwinia amylovora]UDK88805.1 hypothetical protein IRM70_12990 [Erwinia amylovora]UDK92202.1 hypothetical protein IRM71_12990 [Erwinia amylovora]UOD76222.1 hypothetical protein IRM67_08105 [Erwinia amylovora]
MGLLTWIVIGLLVGIVAWRLFPARASGLVSSLVLAAIGALIGGYISSYFEYGSLSVFDTHALLMVLVGALIMAGVGRILRI